MTPDNLLMLRVLACTFVIAACSGFAAMLRSGKEYSLKEAISVTLNSGLLGLVVGLLWYNSFASRNNLSLLVGLAALAGLSGMTLIEFISNWSRGHGVNIVIKPTTAPTSDNE